MNFGGSYGGSAPTSAMYQGGGGGDDQSHSAASAAPITNIHVPSHFSVTPFAQDAYQQAVKKYYWISVVVAFLLVAAFIGGLYWVFRRPIVEMTNTV